MIWLWKEGPGILKTGFKIIGDAVQLIAWGIGKLVDFFFGKKQSGTLNAACICEFDKYMIKQNFLMGLVTRNRVS